MVKVELLRVASRMQIKREYRHCDKKLAQTCVCCKILEHIISSHIRHHLDNYNIISSFQHGFRKLFSCETQLAVTIQDLLSFRDKQIQVDMAILDFSKAFDTVPHKRLLGKLSFYGIKGPIIRWIEAFLVDKIQSVVVEGFRSPLGRVFPGFPDVIKVRVWCPSGNSAWAMIVLVTYK